MALSKYWTLQKVEDLLRVLVNQIAPKDVQSIPLREYINLATQDVCEMLGAAGMPDYHTTTTLNESSRTLGAASFKSVTSFTHATKTLITTLAHSYTSADIGKRFLLVESDASGNVFYVTITKIVSITNTTTLVLQDSPGVDLPQGDGYLVFCGVLPLTAYTSNKLDCDISSLNIDKIIKIVDATNGLVIPAGDSEIEGVTYFSSTLPGNSLKQNNLFWTQNGETISIYKGTSVSTYGVLTLHYYKQPTLVSAVTEYIDVRDKYMPLVIAKAKNMLYEQLGQAPPESLTSLIENKTAEIRRNNIEENTAIKQRAENNK